jgi:hypothetical protein
MITNSSRPTQKGTALKISLYKIWRQITPTRYACALEAEITHQRAENDRLRAETNAQDAEIVRLRAENRALLNSILGIAGIPPILPEGLPGRRLVEPGIPDTPLPSSVSLPAKCHSESAAADDESRSRPSHSSITAAEKNSPGAQRPRNDIPPSSQPTRRQLAPPLRRRSWHQIMRTLEFESGKKKAAKQA